MNSELIMKADLLDIIFENRNKDYGAYTLRKFYANRMLKSLAAMIVTVLAFSAYTIYPGQMIPPVIFEVAEQKLASLPTQKILEKKPELPKPKVAVRVPSQKMLSKIIIVNQHDSADTLRNLQDLAISNKTTFQPPGNGPDIILPGEGTPDAPFINSSPVADISLPVNNPDIMPGYPGGLNALRKFLQKNLANPAQMAQGEVVSVKVKFVVGFDGKLQGFELVEKGGEEFNNEVIRVLKKMPVWLPGKMRGKNVPAYYTIPVKFVGEE